MFLARSLFLIGLATLAISTDRALAAWPFVFQAPAPAPPKPAVQGDLPPDADPYYSTPGGFDKDVDMGLTTRREIADPTGEEAGTLTINTKLRKLFLSLGGGRAIEYRIGVGRQGFAWKGVAEIGRKAFWPGGRRRRKCWRDSPICLRISTAAWATRSAPAPSTCFRTGRTRCSASTAPMSPKHRPRRLFRMHPYAQCRCDRPIQTGRERRPGCRALKPNGGSRRPRTEHARLLESAPCRAGGSPMWKASSLALIFAMATSAARAEPATPEGAKQMLDGYVSDLRPGDRRQGDRHRRSAWRFLQVTWHVQPRIESRPETARRSIPDRRFRLRDHARRGRGVAHVGQCVPFDRFNTPTDQGRMLGKIDLTGMNIDSSYDPARPTPFASRSIFGDIVADLRIVDAGKVIPFHFEESGVQVDLKQTTTDVGANLALHETVGTVVEKLSVPIETQQNAKIDMTFKVGAATVDGTIDQFRTEQALAAWRFVLAHKDEPKDETSVAALKTILTAGLPGWQKMNFTTDLGDLTFDMSLAKAHMKGLRETIDLPGFTEIATGGFGLKIDEFNMRSPFLPQGFEVAAAALAGLSHWREVRRPRSDRQNRPGRPRFHAREGRFARRPGENRANLQIQRADLHAGAGISA